ncbi:MAG: hypothetical protein AAF481_04670 [Acidobacteriota bacterium]
MKLLRILALAVAFAGIWVFLAPPSPSGGSSEAEVSRTFSFDTDPQTTVLTVTYLGGLSGGRTVYLVHGDGRLRREQRSRSGELRRSSEILLSFNQVQALLRVAVIHGFLDLTQEELRAEIVRPLAISDAGTMQVDLEVTSYERAGEEMGARNRTLRLSAPQALHRANPESLAIKGFVELSQLLASY